MNRVSIILFLASLPYTAPSAAAEKTINEVKILAYTGGQGYHSQCGGIHFGSDVEPWLGRMEQKIRKAGFDEKRFKNKRLTIRIDVSHRVGMLTITRSSGFEQTDEAGLSLLLEAPLLEEPEIGWPTGRPLFLDLEYPKLELKFCLCRVPPVI